MKTLKFFCYLLIRLQSRDFFFSRALSTPTNYSDLDLISVSLVDKVKLTNFKALISILFVLAGTSISIAITSIVNMSGMELEYSSMNFAAVQQLITIKDQEISSLRSQVNTERLSHQQAMLRQFQRTRCTDEDVSRLCDQMAQLRIRGKRPISTEMKLQSMLVEQQSKNEQLQQELSQQKAANEALQQSLAECEAKQPSLDYYEARVEYQEVLLEHQEAREREQEVRTAWMTEDLTRRVQAIQEAKDAELERAADNKMQLEYEFDLLGRELKVSKEELGRLEKASQEAATRDWVLRVRVNELVEDNSRLSCSKRALEASLREKVGECHRLSKETKALQKSIRRTVKEATVDVDNMAREADEDRAKARALRVENERLEIEMMLQKKPRFAIAKIDAAFAELDRRQKQSVDLTAELLRTRHQLAECKARVKKEEEVAQTREREVDALLGVPEKANEGLLRPQLPRWKKLFFGW